jgi:hypothetical protein
MKGQDFTKYLAALEGINYQEWRTLKNIVDSRFTRLGNQITLSFKPDYVFTNSNDMKKEPLRATKREHMETAKPRNEWRRFELITEDEKMIAALDSLLDRKQLSREELAIILLSLRVRPGIGEEAFGTELQDTRDSLIGAQ